MHKEKLGESIFRACRRLLSEQNRDPYSPAYGCFDRRYWAWKLVDYPEATFQRNVYPLAWHLKHVKQQSAAMADTLTNSVIAGLHYTTTIQHRDGSYDQAFPHEHSFGATAFLLHPLLEAYRIVRDAMPEEMCPSIEQCLKRSADFLCRNDETHGFISNHLAGAVLSLLSCADYFQEIRYEQRATHLLNQILDRQSEEGWFLEYEGADPGYQTLCIYYLAQAYQLRPKETLKKALQSAANFLAWFVHPDGTFAGEYGSRRTAIFYPGGLALLLKEIPAAASITMFMAVSITKGTTVTIDDVDMGNMAPLLSNYILLHDTPEGNDYSQALEPLPFEQDKVCQNFQEAGLFVRSTKRHYIIFGASNGGVIKVFDRNEKKLCWNDGGYLGKKQNGLLITTQMTDLKITTSVTTNRLELVTSFYRVTQALPTPWQFILLRILNISLMRNKYLGNQVKTILVKLLISGKKKVSLKLVRKLIIDDEAITIKDSIIAASPANLSWLEYGVPFVSIHMASSRYFQGIWDYRHIKPLEVQTGPLNTGSTVETEVTI